MARVEFLDEPFDPAVQSRYLFAQPVGHLFDHVGDRLTDFSSGFTSVARGSMPLLLFDEWMH